MMAGWWSITATNLSVVVFAILRCYTGADQKNELDYCALLRIGTYDVNSPLAMMVSNGQMIKFAWMMLVLMVLAACAPGWDWTRQHAKIRERITLTAEEARRRNSYP
ncbi:hypothetical protein AK830_g8916 [Neonectria ditissima]|uniref:Uncharacterized protein n=1 Tax=Neonectria ditissima TaxID=78410 RepID=A0A0P7BA70_9HYPO|nr:hypothetical protein AK830_g8916 [Neonectria ditissima]